MKPEYNELENQIAELKKQNEILKLSVYSDKISEIQYGKIVDNIGDVIVIIDSKGLNKYKSPNIEKYFGWKPKDVIGKSTFDNVHKDDVEFAQEFIETLMSHPNVVKTIEIRYKCKDGTYKWIEFSCRNLLENPEINGFLGNYHDITERKQAEERIKQQSLDLEFLNSMAIPLADKSAVHDFSKVLLQGIKNHTGANFAAFSVYDSDKKALLPLHVEFEPGILKTVIKIAGEKITKTASPVDDKAYGMIIEKIVGQCQTFTEVSFGAIPKFIDKAIRTSTGIDRIYPIAHVIEGELYGTSLIAFKKGQADPSVQLLETYSHLMSVSLRRSNVEKAMNESENRFRILFEQSSDGIIIHETNLKILHCNKAIIDILGFDSKTDFSKLNILDISFKFQENNILSADLAPKHVENCLKFGKTRFEWIYEKTNGDLIIFDIILTKIIYQNKTTIHSLWRDITASKKHEKELIFAKEKAEESDQLKSAFLANMSHEIRTPMNGILGFTELLQNSNLSVENQKGYIGIIRKSSDRLLNTVNDIIEISKIESGDIKINKSEVDLIGHLNTLVSFFKPEAERKNLEIVVQNNIEGNDLTITTDKTKLDSILSNLIKNAIKYTNDGTIKIGLKIENRQILFSCQDSGIGIPKNRHEAIFNRFEQADIDDKQAHQGSGLGLAIVKSYVEMMDGKIWVESEEGLGSTFYVLLPYNSENKKEHNLLRKINSSDSDIKNINVLIVEDDEFSSLHLVTVMNGITKNIRTAKTGIEAVDACKNDLSIDLILMDIRMPGMDGFEATKKIREFNNEVVIIAQTAFAFEEDKQNALDAGCTDYISKPIKKDKLCELISKYLS